MNKLLVLTLFIVGAFAALFAVMRNPVSAAAHPPTNHATLQLSHIWATVKFTFGVVLLQIDELAGKFGFGRALVAIGLTETADEKILKAVDALNSKLSRVEEIEKSATKNKEDLETVTRLVGDVAKDMANIRKLQIEGGASRVRRVGEVSRDCAAHLGAIGLLAAYKTPGADLKEEQKEMIARQVKGILGVEIKAALTSSDIPLPVQYSAEIVEFVYEYGQARKYGTVFPLGAASVKLPKLTTDPTFGLIATSGSVPEKSPQIAFVTFTAEKFGGLIRLPEEIDEDSIVAMGQFIARYAARNIAYVEDWQFFMSTGAASGLNGTGPGLVTATVTDACFVYNGNAAASGKTKPSDATLADFRNMRNASTLSGIVLSRAKYYMHPTYEALLVSFNTSATVTPYQRSAGGSPATLDGFEIVWVYVMPAYSTSAAVGVVQALFGDVSYQYLGLRNGIRFDTSRDAAFATDEILIRALERMTVGLMASKAVAALRNSTS